MKIGPFSTVTPLGQPLLTDSFLDPPIVAAASGPVVIVETGEHYPTMAAAVQAAQSGDTIEVQAGTYTNDFLSIGKSLTLKAVGGVVKMVETQSPPNGKAMIDEGGSGISVTINGFEISGVAVSSGNGAAIRYEGGSLTLNDDYFHDNQDGMLAADDPTGTIHINHSEFAFNGTGDGATHNLYVNVISNLTITDSFFHDAIVGHEIKSRALNTTITGTRVFDNDSTASYSIEIANAGNATINNNQIQQGQNSQNSAIIWYGSESGATNPGTTVTIDNNTIVNDKTGAAVGVQNTSTVTIGMDGNQVYGLTSSNLTSGPVAVSNTTYLSSRPTLDEFACADSVLRPRHAHPDGAR